MVFQFFTIRFFTPCFLLVFGLTGCAGTTGGNMGRAWTVNGQCEAILEWAQQFEHEIPVHSLKFDGRRNQAIIANLYRPDRFEPVFGFPYDQSHEARMKNISKDVLPYCYWGKKGQRVARILDTPFRKMFHTKGASPETVQAFRPFKMLVEAGFPFKEAMAREVGERLRDEAWRQQALSDIADVPATRDEFIHLQDYYLATGEQKVLNLWPSEQTEYLRRVTVRREEIAKVLLDDALPPPEQLPDSLASLDQIREAKPYLMVLKESGDRDVRTLAKSYEDQKRKIVASLIKDHVDSLMTIPLTEDGFELTQEWFEAFQRKFAHYFDLETVKQALRTFQDKRQAVFEHNRQMIDDRFASLGMGNIARQKEQTLLSETFPLPSDYHLPFYREFRAHYRNTGDSIVLEMLDKSQNIVVNYHQAITGFIRDWLYGRPE
jgi:hypothetical protein